MEPEKLDRLLNVYKVNQARYTWLCQQLEKLEADLKVCRSQMISEQISLSQALTGMPHGSGTTDPTAKVAVAVTSGKVTPFVKELEAEIKPVREEMLVIQKDINTVDLALSPLAEREREVVTYKMIDNLDWGEVLEMMNEKYNGTYAKRTLQRLYDRGIEKAYAVIA